ncbi:MAG: EAL domain-containing protein [Campylobacterota bacterium]|nr:EAL domain-containing protein [Campylobacterota bacterium]
MSLDLQLEKELQEYKDEIALYHIMCDATPDLVWLKDKDGTYLKCNSKFEQYYGASQAEIVGKTDYDFLKKSIANSIREHDLIAINAKKPIISEELLSFSDNSFEGTFETIKTPLRDKDGNFIAFLGVARDINDRKEREEKLKIDANYDSLTGLTNRSIFMDKVKQEVRLKKDYSCILLIDLDRFKDINETMGHSTGDKILIMVAQRLQKLTKKSDTLSRLGGDEFAILLSNIKDPLKARDFAQKVIRALAKPYVINSRTYHLSVSIGISVSPDDSNRPERLLQFADNAMHKAKEKGNNLYELYTKELSFKILENIFIVDSLRNAIKNREFELFYQPQIDAKTDKTVGAEALIRWDIPQKGPQSPAKFIPLAESSGLILDIGRWIIDRALKDIVQWKKAGLDIEKISINLSIKQLSDEELIPYIIEKLQKTGAKAEWIEFEITESYTMHNQEASIKKLNKLVEMGFTLSIDDFGTGYSSLSYLKKLPVKKLKIDKAFVDDIERGKDDKAIVQAVILIAKSMHLSIIAEGVETQKQEDLLLEYGCDLIQGHLYSEPLRKKEFEEFLSSTS